jgi:acyl dehydratase
MTDLTSEDVERLPLYEWEVAEIGDAAPPFAYEVTVERTRDYCLAVRDDNPLYLDETYAKRTSFGGLIAPPTMAYTYAPPRRNEVMRARGYASPEEKGDRATPYAKSEIFYHGVVRPGDVITSVVWLADKYERRGNQFMTFRVEANNQREEKIVDYTYTVIWRYASGQKKG